MQVKWKEKQSYPFSRDRRGIMPHPLGSIYQEMLQPVSLYSNLQKKILFFCWKAKIKIFEKIFCTRTTQLQLLCAENNLNLNFSRKKSNRKWKVVRQPGELRERWMLLVIRDPQWTFCSQKSQNNRKKFFNQKRIFEKQSPKIETEKKCWKLNYSILP